MMGITTKISIGLVLVILMLLGLGYWYYNSTQQRIELLTIEKARLELAVGLQKQTIEKQQEFMAQQNEENTRLQNSISDAESERDIMTEVLRSHDVESIKDQPELIQERSNITTWRLYRNIENETLKWYEDSYSRRNK
jgi:hypothetical protein